MITLNNIRICYIFKHFFCIFTLQKCIRCFAKVHCMPRKSTLCALWKCIVCFTKTHYVLCGSTLYTLQKRFAKVHQVTLCLHLHLHMFLFVCRFGISDRRIVVMTRVDISDEYNVHHISYYSSNFEKKKLQLYNCEKIF